MKEMRRGDGKARPSLLRRLFRISLLKLETII